MRCSALLLLGLGLPCPSAIAAAQPAPPVVRSDPAAASETISAATAKAVSSLAADIGSMPLSSSVTVAQLIKRLDAEDDLTATLQRADQIGGPRWLDEYTCQVQLEIPATRVGQTLKQIAGANPANSPVTAAEIELAIRQWPRRTFAATGTSAAAVKLVELRPRAGDQWAQIPDKARQQALAEASSAAVRRALLSVADVPLANSATLGDAFALPEVDRPIGDWLAARPVTRVDFQEDLHVQVSLGVDEQEFFDQVRSALLRQDRIPIPRDEQAWERIQREFISRLRPATGRAPVSRPVGLATTRAVFRLPAPAPSWADEQLDVEGQAPFANTKLQTARRAEADARFKLRERVEALKLNDSLTLGQAARDHRHVADAIERALERARIYRTEYNGYESASVRLTFHLRDLWEELRR